VLERIVGRGRNLMSMPDGTRRWPGCDLIHLDVVPGIRQHQFVQTALDRIELFLVADQPLSQADQESLATVVRACLGQGLEVAVVRVERLPHAAGGGFDEFVNLLSH
jgi:phenylacetate-CoA ligase